MQLIPKLIHQIWYQSKTIPEQLKKYSDSWKRNHPEYKYILWNKETIEPEIKKLNKKFQDTYFNYQYDIQRIDFAKIVILKNYGGIYSDLDLLSIRNISTLLNRGQSFYISKEKKNQIGNAIIASTSHNYILNIILDEYYVKSLIHYKNLNKLHIVLNTTGPISITRIFKKYNIFNSKKVDYNTFRFYPIEWKHKNLKYNLENKLFKDSYGIHMWKGLWRHPP